MRSSFKNLRRHGAVLIGLLIATTVCADEALIPYELFVLDNGLTLIVHEDRKAPIVSVNIWYHVGSKNERPGQTGFAHLFEHLMFQGSENFDGEYIESLQQIGATDLNGTTWFDRTNYFQPGALAGIRPHGTPARSHRPGQAGRTAGRGTERKAAGRKPAV
jgi:hypothetical protein